MKNTKKGFIIPLVIAIIAILVVGAIVYLKMRFSGTTNNVAPATHLAEARTGFYYNNRIASVASTSKVSVVEGSLPSGLAINYADTQTPCLPPASGGPVNCPTDSGFWITGKTNVAGIYHFSVQVDSSLVQSFSLSVVDAPMPVNPTTPDVSGPAGSNSTIPPGQNSKSNPCANNLNDPLCDYYVINKDASSTNAQTLTVSPVPIPNIISISPSSGPVGTVVEIDGVNLSGLEGDLMVTFERMDGKKITLTDTFGDYAKTGDKQIKVTVKEPCQKGETVYGSYSGIPAKCDYVQLAPGIYRVYATPWGKSSNVMNFTITN